MLYSDGQKYIGQWKNGYMHGLGTITLPDEKTYEA